jgi:putative heme-binding domain-containing protein
LNWLQLDAPSLSASAREKAGMSGTSELQRLVQLGLLHVKNRPDRPMALAHPSDTTQPLADRARSWLHVNCSTCHRFGAGGSAAIHLNFDKPARELRAINERPTRGDFGIADARLIAPAEPYRSTLFYRILTEGHGHMPAIGSRLADDQGVALVREWIRSLPPAGGPPEVTQNLPADSGSFVPEIDTMSEAMRCLDEIIATLSGPITNHTVREAEQAVRDSHAALGNAHTNALIRDLFQRLLPASQRRKTLGPDIQPHAILGLSGDADRGKAVFLGPSQCARCHVCAGEGRAFGPDLSAAARPYSRAELLDHILHPSQVIAPGFKTTTLTLRDDTELNGFMLQQSSDQIVLRDESLTEHRVQRRDVAQSRESTESAMPEGLLAPLTAQEAADLVEFLYRAQPAAIRPAK